MEYFEVREEFCRKIARERKLLVGQNMMKKERILGKKKKNTEGETTGRRGRNWERGRKDLIGKSLKRLMKRERVKLGDRQ